MRTNFWRACMVLVAVVAGAGFAQAEPLAAVPDSVRVENAGLEAVIDTRDGTMAVTDRASDRAWRQATTHGEVRVVGVEPRGEGEVGLMLVHVPTGMELAATVRVEPTRPEVVVTLDGAADAKIEQPVMWPHPFVTEPGTYLVLPMNEGIAYDVDDTSVEPRRMYAYGGHGMSMSFFGASDGRAGYMGILETPDDAAVRVDRVAPKAGGEPLLAVAPQWEAQRGVLGYAREIRYVFLAEGGHTAIAKRYREHAQARGLVKTLAEKRESVPQVDMLVGAVNVWSREKGAALELLEAIRAAGIERVLWSHRGSPEQIERMNELGVLTSRYDIYQDVMDPAQFPRLVSVHTDWVTGAWPKDLMIRADGEWVRGWEVATKDTPTTPVTTDEEARARKATMVPCGVLCDRQAPPYVRERLTAELATHAYRCRFIDTTTSTPWRECYHPDHPMTRTQSREAKVALLRVVSEEFGLVCGAETGHEAAVPAVHYFEGMMTLGPYRVPDSGRDAARMWDEVPERVAKYQVGHRYRLPLWELVYHDCVVAHWYWGDYSHKLPALWDARDRFNALYGTPPMFWVTREIVAKYMDRLVQSYRATTPIARATGYSEMLSHEHLTEDRAVQRTVFANGVTVTVNFDGERERTLADGSTIAAGAVVTTGMPE